MVSFSIKYVFHIKSDEDYAYIKIRTSKTGAIFLAQQFVDWVEILEPEHIRNEFKGILSNALNRYK